MRDVPGAVDLADAAGRRDPVETQSTGAGKQEAEMLGELAEAVRNRDVTPVELVETALARIEKANPSLNAVVDLRADAALEEARRHNGEGVLAGIPILVKDLEHVRGMTTTYGSLLHAEDPPAERHGGVASRLVEAGAIVVGKTNTPEYAWAGFTTNRVYGPTRNPWNTDKAPGGSSGGSSAALCSGMAPLATSSDGGGSVRTPASTTGLVGFKPTFGAIGRSAIPTWPTFSMNGVIQASVTDAILEAGVIFGPVAGDVNALPGGSIPLDPTLPSRAVAVDTFKAQVEPAVMESFHRVLEIIEVTIGLPVELRERHEPVFDTDPTPANGWLFMAAAEMAQRLSFAKGREDDLDIGLRLMIDFGRHVQAADYIAAQRNRYEAARQLDNALGEEGVLLVPTANANDWPAEGPLPAEIAGVPCSPLDSMNTMELNYTGHPAVSVPMGIGPSGVPHGLQIVAPRHRDDLALGLAAALEDSLGWPTTAPGYEAFPLP